MPPTANIVYEVNLTIASAIAEEYAAWLDGHIRDILAIDGFVSAEWFEVESDGEERCWTVCYRLRDVESLDRYFAEHAERMRAEGVDRFGGKFTAARRVMELRKSFEC